MMLQQIHSITIITSPYSFSFGFSGHHCKKSDVLMSQIVIKKNKKRVIWKPT